MDDLNSPPATAHRVGGVSRRIAMTALAAVLVSGGLAASAQAARFPQAVHADHRADSQVSVNVRHRVLTITGTAGSDTLALRLRAGDPARLDLDVGDDGSAACRFDAAGLTASSSTPETATTGCGSTTQTAPSRLQPPRR